MILYTEKQLIEAYSMLTARLTIADSIELIPTLEDLEKYMKRNGNSTLVMRNYTNDLCRI